MAFDHNAASGEHRDRPSEEGGGLIEAPALRDQVYARLREAILAGELAEGERVSPVQVARGFGISTMPVREALRLLEQDGLVETAARRWTRVVQIDRGMVAELIPLIAVLEAFAVEIGQAPTEEQLARMRRANDDFARAIDARDPMAAFRADTQFHDVIVAIAHSTALERALLDAKSRIQLLRAELMRLDGAAESVAQHEQIIAALKAGDREEAARIVRANWQGGLEAFRDTRAES